MGKCTVKLSELERNLVVNGLLGLRHDAIEHDAGPDEVDDLIIKIIDSPEEKERWRDDHEER